MSTLKRSGILLCIICLQFVLKGGCSSAKESDYKLLKKKGHPIVDKSSFIKEVMEDPNLAVIITRPPKFGKSFCLSMLYHFLNAKDTTASLLHGLAISKDKKFCERVQNKHPVLRLSLGAVNKPTWEEAKKGLSDAIKEMYKEHDYLLVEQPVLKHSPDSDLQAFKFIVSEEGESNLHILQLSLRDLAELVGNHHNKSVVLLVDDYDTPVVSAHMNGFNSEMISFINGIFSRALKSPFRHPLRKVVMMGTTQAAPGSVFSGWNIVETYPVWTKKFSAYFGFNESETRQVIQKFGCDKSLLESLVRKYSGYTIGNSLLLNPWSVLRCVNKGAVLGDYWFQSQGGVDNFVELMKPLGPLAVLEAQMLVANLTLTHEFEPKFSLAKVKNDFGSFWSYITQLGYLTFRQKSEVAGRLKRELRVPNQELRGAFQALVAETQVLKLGHGLKNFTELAACFVQGNSSTVQETLQSFVNAVPEELLREESPSGTKKFGQFLMALLQSLKFYGEVEVRPEKDGVSAELKSGPKSCPHRIKFVVTAKKEGLVRHYSIKFGRVSKSLKKVELTDTKLLNVTVALRKAGGKK